MAIQRDNASITKFSDLILNMESKITNARENSTMPKKYHLLDNIDTPEDLKKVSRENLRVLTNEVRDFLIDSLDVSGGHFASSLGALELSIALHYVYNTPLDKIVWDVGHQAYVHKILTGRKNQLKYIKKPGGISGFPKISESKYDAFGVGHSSTSISAALGMSEGIKLKKEPHRAVAVIGDGAITGGMAFEALNHAGGMHSNILIILNDNEMSISANVGALSNYLAKILSGSVYNSIRESSKKLLKKLPVAWDVAKKFESQAKGMITPGNLFEALGFYYVGPVDGHDMNLLVDSLDNMKMHKGPRILHVITKKGKGYLSAEKDPIKFHHVSPRFHSGEKGSLVKENNKINFCNVFGEWICNKAGQDSRLVGITPAMCEGSDLVRFSKEYPKRYFDTAIAEQHAVTFAAGLACEGFKPVVAIYSTFLQRAYDQVIHDVSIQNLDVLYAVDRAGLVGADGSTHAGSFDLSFMRCIPNTVIMAPSDENECYHMLDFGYEHVGPVMVRYPRGYVTGLNERKVLDISLGKSNILRYSKNKKIAILSFGTVLKYAEEVARRVDVTVVDMRFIKPLDETLIRDIAASHKGLVTIEENSVLGGAGSAINEFLVNNDLLSNLKVRNIGLPDVYLEHGQPDEMLAKIGISVDGIELTIKELGL
jgi:1-deoxy-D-xylulose-5-phosphate synthase